MFDIVRQVTTTKGLLLLSLVLISAAIAMDALK